MEKLEVSLFGAMQVMRGENPLTNFGSNKVRALFAYLVVEANQVHQRRKLAALLWPELPETNALSNLRYALSNLRKVIEDRSAQPAYLITTAQTIQINSESDLWVDVIQFEKSCEFTEQNPLDLPSLRRAADLYPDCFLAGFSIPDSIPYEEWMVLKREHFERLALAIMKERLLMLKDKSRWIRGEKKFTA
jgi:DNA-binding SARP family transcriptional activator